MEKKTKMPLTDRVAKVPVILQLEALECGAAALVMVLAYYNKWIPLEQVRVNCGVSRDGSNAKNILLAARGYGMTAKGYRYEPHTLKHVGECPCIIHWNFNHFVVLNGFKKNKAVINDPARGLVEIPMEEFDKAFTGICIMLKPAAGFVADGRKKSILGFVKKQLKGTQAVMLFTVLVSLITALIGIINPVFARVFMDRLLTGKNPTWILPFFLLLAAFTLIHVIIDGMNAVYSLKIQGKLAIKANAQYMWHVLRMPVEFFSQRMAGDIAARKSSNAAIASALINTLAPTALNMIMMLVYLIVILRYSVILSLIGVGGMLIHIVVNQYISKKRVNITRVQMRDEAKLVSHTAAGIEMIETIKASGAENGFFEKWSGFQASVNTQNVKTIRLNQYFGLIPQIISGVVDVVILAFGLSLIIDGAFTVGILFAFQTMLSSFMAPVKELDSAGAAIREMRTNMERIEDVMEYPVDVDFQKESSAAAEFDKLSGKIELKHVTFGYSRLAPPLIVDFSMMFDAIFSTGLTAVFSLVYLGQVLSFAPALVAPALLITLLTLVSSAGTSYVQMNITEKRMIEEGKESGMVYALINGVAKIKNAGAEKRAFAKWSGQYSKAARYLYQPPMLLKMSSVITTAISLLGTIVMYYAAIHSSIRTADYMAFNSAYGMVSGAFTALSGIAVTVAQVKPILRMVQPILEAEPEIDESRKVVTGLCGSIELNNVSFRYNQTMPNVLEDLSLKIRPGQYIAIVGKTGCGKSTLMRILLGFERPQKGAVYYDGKDITSMDLKSLRRKIGVVMQNGRLFQGDIYSNITISAPQLTLAEAWTAAELSGMAEDIRQMPMGMNTLIAEGQGGISGGQRQRLMIARAIAPKPRILMFDEATSALDNITQSIVSESLERLKCTRIVIAHRLSTIRRCDRIIVLDKGLIVEDGSYEELLKMKGHFSELVARQRIDNNE